MDMLTAIASSFTGFLPSFKQIKEYLNRPEVKYTALLSTFAILAAYSSFPMSPLQLLLVTIGSAGASFASVKVVQYCIQLAQSIQEAVQQLNGLLKEANKRAKELEDITQQVKTITDQVEELSRHLKEKEPGIVEKIEKLSEELNATAKNINEKDIPEKISGLTKQLEDAIKEVLKQLGELNEAAKEGVEDFSDLAKNFGNNGITFAFGGKGETKNNAAPSDEDPKSKRKRAEIK